MQGCDVSGAYPGNTGHGHEEYKQDRIVIIIDGCGGVGSISIHTNTNSFVLFQF